MRPGLKPVQKTVSTHAEQTFAEGKSCSKELSFKESECSSDSSSRFASQSPSSFEDLDGRNEMFLSKTSGKEEILGSKGTLTAKSRISCQVNKNPSEELASLVYAKTEFREKESGETAELSSFQLSSPSMQTCGQNVADSSPRHCVVNSTANSVQVRRNLRSSEITSHKKFRSFQCKLSCCLKCFSSVLSLRQHQLQHHENLLNTQLVVDEIDSKKDTNIGAFSDSPGDYNPCHGIVKAETQDDMIPQTSENQLKIISVRSLKIDEHHMEDKAGIFDWNWFPQECEIEAGRKDVNGGLATVVEEPVGEMLESNIDIDRNLDRKLTVKSKEDEVAGCMEKTGSSTILNRNQTFKRNHSVLSPIENEIPVKRGRQCSIIDDQSEKEQKPMSAEPDKDQEFCEHLVLPALGKLCKERKSIAELNVQTLLHNVKFGTSAPLYDVSSAISRCSHEESSEALQGCSAKDVNLCFNVIAPALRDMTENQNSWTKIEIQRILHEARFKH